MVETIITKYHGPTETKGARFIARCSEGSAVVSRDYAVRRDVDHARAAEKLARKLGWHGRWIGAYLPNGCMVWVPAVGRVIDVSSEE